jgi:hypothetical protein
MERLATLAAMSTAVERSGEVPIQYFQSVIAIELGVAGALLFQVHYFDRDPAANPRSDPWMLLFMAIVIAATLFGCLEAMREGWGSLAAAMVTVGVAVSLLPILLRVLPPITRDLESRRHDPHRWITVLALALYVVVVTVIVLIR